MMIEIDLPGAENIYVISDLSSDKGIQNAFIASFNPYTTVCGTKPLKKGFLLETDGNYLKGKRIGDEFSWKKENVLSLFGVYKHIYSVIRNSLHLRAGYCYLHGAAVLIEGKLCLLLAESGIGKTTLAVYLDMQGYPCLTDDLIMISEDDFSVFPISSYAHLRGESLTLLNTLGGLDYDVITKRYLYPLNTNEVFEKIPIQYVLVLKRSKDNVSQIQKSDAPFENIQCNMFLPCQIKQNIISSLRIVRNIPVYDFVYGDLDVAMHQLVVLCRKTDIN